MDILSREEFIKLLRNDLNHLYDPDHLQRSELVDIFGVRDQVDIPSTMNRILVNAIASLKPPDNSSHRKAWEIYESLFYRYVEQLSPQEVADQLAIGLRHLRRKQHTALQALADSLWSQYHLREKTGKEANGKFKEVIYNATESSIEKELAWLKNPGKASAAVVSETLATVLNWARRFSEQHGARLTVELPIHLPGLAIHAVALQQIFLNLFSVVIPHARGAEVHFTARSLTREVQFQINCREGFTSQNPLPGQDLAALSVTRRLVEISGCRFNLVSNSVGFMAALIVQSQEEVPVLVIDDNSDTLQMLRRYTSGTHYHIVAAQDPEQALDLAEKYFPRIIVLDIMMPQKDGWLLLEQFRHTPSTADARIIVFSIIGQSEFALFMGADAYLSKPVTRQVFLDALDQQAGSKEIESH